MYLDVKKFTSMTIDDAKEILEYAFDMNLIIDHLVIRNLWEIDVKCLSEWNCLEDDEEISFECEDYLTLTPTGVSGMDFSSPIEDQEKYRKSLFAHGYVEDSHYEALLPN